MRPRFLHAGDGGVIVDFSRGHGRDSAMRMARNLAGMIRGDKKLMAEHGILDVIPGFTNVTLQYDSVVATSDAIIAGVTPLAQKCKPDAGVLAGSRHWIMPALYGGEGGADMEDVAKRTGLTIEEIITRHTACIFGVALMGFMPGLAYLEGLDPALALPRRATPRKRVPALSLGIAMDQSTIYPLDSPGGWNLIGRVPVRVFDKARGDDAILFMPGDTVAFRSITAEEFAELDARAARGEKIISPVKRAG